MSTRRRVLLKLTGEVLLSQDKKSLTASVLNTIIMQIKKLHATYDFGIVIGGGNFFRGNQHGRLLGLTASAGHNVGMLATMMNGIIIKDLFEQHGLKTVLLSALPCSEIGSPITTQAITDALNQARIIVFMGGTGNPFFTTDTSAILRGLQMNADEIWKGTLVDGVYSSDPKKDPQAILLHTVSYQETLEHRYGIMDLTAFALASEHKMPIRIFNIFAADALQRVVEESGFGTRIS